MEDFYTGLMNTLNGATILIYVFLIGIVLTKGGMQLFIRGLFFLLNLLSILFGICLIAWFLFGVSVSTDFEYVEDRSRSINAIADELLLIIAFILQRWAIKKLNNKPV